MEYGTADECVVKDEGDRRSIGCKGELCLATVAPLRDALMAALDERRATALELSAVTGIDFAGLQLLCSAHRSFRDRGVAFAVEGLSQECRRTAGAGGFDSHTSTCPSRDESCLWKTEGASGG